MLYMGGARQHLSLWGECRGTGQVRVLWWWHHCDGESSAECSCSNACLCPLALAQRVQPGQGLH